MRVQLKTKIIFLLSIFCLQRLLYSQYPEAPEKWSIPEKVLAISNNLFSASYPYLASDGSALYFNGVTVTFWTDTGWSIPQNLNSSISSNLAQKPCISLDGKKLYFTKFISSWDLYEAEWDAITNDWINVKKVNGNINTSSYSEECGCFPNDTTFIFLRNSSARRASWNSQTNIWDNIVDFPVPYLAFHSDHGMHVTEDMKKVYYVHARTDIDRYGQYYFNYDLIISYKDTTNPTGYGLPKTLNISTLSDSGHFAGNHALRFEGYPTLSRNGRMMYFAADYDSQLTIYSSRMIIDENGDSVTNLDEVIEMPPREFVLYQNYPNPFNPTTKIKYAVSNATALFSTSNSKQERQFVSLKIYDILGNQVATLVNEEKESGVFEVEFDASKLSSGVYFYRLQTGNFIQTMKMILMR